MICGDFFVFIDNPKGSLTGKNIEHSQTEAEIAKLKAETVKLNAKAAKMQRELERIYRRMRTTGPELPE